MKSQTFGEKIKELRLDSNFTLKFVGNQIEYSPRLLSEIEKNKRRAPEKIIKGLSKIYKASFKELSIKYLSENIYYNIRTSDYAESVINEVKKRLEKEGKGTRTLKSKEAIIRSLKSYFTDKPIEKAWVFGSFAKNTIVSMDSDLDIMVVFKKPNKISLFDIIQMKEELSNETGREIDLVEEGQELKSFRNSINRERVLVYAS